MDERKEERHGNEEEGSVTRTDVRVPITNSTLSQEAIAVALEAPLKILARLLLSVDGATEVEVLMKSDFRALHEALDAILQVTTNLGPAVNEFQTALPLLGRFRDLSAVLHENRSGAGDPEEGTAREAKLAYDEAVQHFHNCEKLTDEAFLTLTTIEEKLQAVKLSFAAVVICHLENPEHALFLMGAKLQQLHADPRLLSAMKSKYETKGVMARALCRMGGGTHARDALLAGVAALHAEMMLLYGRGSPVSTFPAVYGELALEQLGRVRWLGRRQPGDPVSPLVARMLCSNVSPASITLLERAVAEGGATCDLHGQSVSDEGALLVAAAVETRSTVFTSLSMYSNAIGAAGAQALATALQNNTTLTTLDLSNNAIGAAGTQALAAALEHNTTLTTLKLELNTIGDEGALALAALLRSNTALVTLFLEYNDISEAGFQALRAAAENHPSLTELSLYHDHR